MGGKTVFEILFEIPNSQALRIPFDNANCETAISTHTTHHRRTEELLTPPYVYGTRYRYYDAGRGVDNFLHVPGTRYQVLTKLRYQVPGRGGVRTRQLGGIFLIFKPIKIVHVPVCPSHPARPRSTVRKDPEPHTSKTSPSGFAPRSLTEINCGLPTTATVT
jgi:hypothetical protein